MHEPSDYWTEFAERLAALGVKTRLIGALAAMQYRAQPRVTTDVDFLAASLDGVPDALRAAGYECEVVSDADGEPFAVFVRGKGHRVDILKAETEYQRQVLDRGTGPAITVEDVVVHKLIAWRPRDRDDVAQIFAAGCALDESYIEHWAETWEVEDRWAEAKRIFARPE